MSLLERMRANLCRVEGCTETRSPDSDVCAARHLAMKWRNELNRRPDGAYVEARRFAARDLTGQIRSALA